MTTYLIANTLDALGGNGWIFDSSNFLVGPLGTGINVGAPANPDQANSVNVEGNLYINGTSATTLFAGEANPTFTGTATFATLNAATANVATCQAAHYELNGVDIKAGRAFVQAGPLVPGGFTPVDQVFDQFVGLNQTVTPAVSGLVYVLFSCQMSVATPNEMLARVYYGTGTPPTQGQPLNDTPNYVFMGTAAMGQVVTGFPLLQTAPCTGIFTFQGTVGTTYWVDAQVIPFNSVTGGNATISNVFTFLVEV